MPTPQEANLSMPTPQEVEEINLSLQAKTPQQILKWALDTHSNVFQTTAFGPTGICIIDMLSNLKQPPLIFIDTLHLAEKYFLTLHTILPNETQTLDEFNKKYGKESWKTTPSLYDYTVKTEPVHRAYKNLKVSLVITGRRQSQGASRKAIPVIEFDNSGPTPVWKLNPLAFWSYDMVWEYIRGNEGVLYNPLHDKGFTSIGDWHSTVATTGSAGERGGRWVDSEKTECGLHLNYFEMKRQAKLQEQKK